MSNKPEHISHWQVLTLIVTFEAGSSIVLGVGNKAGQDVWIALLIATALGIGLIYGYFLLLAKHPGENLFEIMERVIGTRLAKGLILIYLVYYLYMSSVVVRDFVEMIATTILIETPEEVIAGTLVLVIVYILYLGIEVLARTTEIFLPYVLCFLLLLCILLFFSGNVHPNNILPVLAEGWGPILHAVFPEILGFPFADMGVFMLVLGHVTRFREAGKTGMIAVALSGVFLTLTSVIQIMTLGADIRSRTQYPLLNAARSISIADFIERVDALVVFITLIGIVVKASLFLYASLKGIERVFGIPYRSILLPAGMIVSVASVLVGQNFSDYVSRMSELVVPFVELPLQIGIPLLLLLAILWQRRKERGKPGGMLHETNR